MVGAERRTVKDGMILGIGEQRDTERRVNKLIQLKKEPIQNARETGPNHS